MLKIKNKIKQCVGLYLCGMAKSKYKNPIPLERDRNLVMPSKLPQSDSKGMSGVKESLPGIGHARLRRRQYICRGGGYTSR